MGARSVPDRHEARFATPRHASSTLALADVLDDRLSAGLRLYRSLSGSGVLRGLEPVADADCDRTGGLHGVRGEYRAACGGGEAWQRGEATDGDEHC